jgi:hypothetical protein
MSIDWCHGLQRDLRGVGGETRHVENVIQVDLEVPLLLDLIERDWLRIYSAKMKSHYMNVHIALDQKVFRVKGYQEQEFMRNS